MNRPPSTLLSRLRSRQGFTLIEVVMATFVMTFALGSAIITIDRGFGSLDTARCLSYASQIMQSEMEKMRLMQWSAVSAFPTVDTTVDISSVFYHGSNDIGSRMHLTRRANPVLDAAGNPQDGMLMVTYTISWTTLDGRLITRKYITYYGRNGLYDFFAA